MSTVCRIIKWLSASIGATLAYYIGGMDGVIEALIAVVTVDYVSGVMSAIINKELSSAVGYKGIFRKVLIFALVGLGNMIDLHVIKQGTVLRTAVAFYYIANEGISIIENCAVMGMPIPKKLKDALLQLKKEDDENVDSEQE